MDPQVMRKSVFERPELVMLLFIAVSVTVWTLQCSLFQNVFGIDIFETIVWGEELQWGHSKHPPLSGWLGYFFSWVTGHRDWGLYLAAQLCIGTGVFFTFKLARLFFDRYRAVTAALLLYTLLYYTPSEMKFCTYLVEIAIAPLAAYLLLRGLREDLLRYWAALGFVCALGILNKYSFGLVMAGFALVVLTRREYRARLASWKPYFAAVVFLAAISPHLKWLIDHHFVCFRHVGARLDEQHSMLMPLFVLGAALYPMAMEILAMALTLFFSRPLGAGRVAANREALHFAAIISLLPGAVYLGLSLAGTDIILMWLCSVASLSGVAVMALCPFEIDARVFKRFSLLLALFIALVFVGMTIDLLCRTADGVHMKTAPVVAQAEAFWRRNSPDRPNIPLVVGGLRYAALVDHYSQDHPPVCEPDDELMIEIYRDRIRKHGALLIDAREQDFEEFLKRAGNVKVRFVRGEVRFGSRFGKKKTRRFVMAYLPPGTEVK